MHVYFKGINFWFWGFIGKFAANNSEPTLVAGRWIIEIVLKYSKPFKLLLFLLLILEFNYFDYIEIIFSSKKFILHVLMLN